MGYGEKANINSKWNRIRTAHVKVPSTTQSFKVSTQSKSGEPNVVELSLKNVFHFFKGKIRWLKIQSTPPPRSLAQTS